MSRTLIIYSGEIRHGIRMVAAMVTDVSRVEITNCANVQANTFLHHAYRLSGGYEHYVCGIYAGINWELR